MRHINPKGHNYFCILILLTMSVIFSACNRGEVQKPSIIEIYYCEWLSSHIIALSCEDLVNFSDDLGECGKIVIKNPPDIEIFWTEFNHLTLNEISERESVDARICCLLYTREGSILETISFGSPINMQVGNKKYRTDETFLNFVVARYLPHGYLHFPTE